jgi:nucleoside-diphosphate-sugar epimerase
MIETVQQLEDALAQPSAADVAFLRRVPGDILILGAGGKMGPSLAHRIRRACDEAGDPRRIVAVSRFSSAGARAELEQAGIETRACDLLDPAQLGQLPESENVLYLAGRKFGSTERSDLTWVSNTLVPAQVARRFAASRIVVFSTGNVYPFVTPASGGAVETDAPEPRGEYANSCLGRERIFEYFARAAGTRCLLFRLNYATDLRYGVLVDIARKVHAGQPVSLSVPSFNTLWQGDANSYALRALELCAAPARVLNVTGPETIAVRQAAAYFGQRFNRPVIFAGEAGATALLNNAALCHQLLGDPEIALGTLMDWVAHWVMTGSATLDQPTKFEVTSGRF